MRAQPIMLRELNAEAKRNSTYLLRIASATWSLLWLCIAFPAGSPSAEDGARIFAALTLGLFALLWLAAPLFTFDCLSQERRENTLPLLFLTPLKPFDVVLGKGTAHMTRACTVWAAALPVLLVPVFMGGVGGFDAIRAALIQGAALILGMAAGLAASACCTAWWASLGLAMLWSAGTGFLLVSLQGVWRMRGMIFGDGNLPELSAFTRALQLYFDGRLLRLPFWETQSKYGGGFNAAARGGPVTPADASSVMIGALMLLAALLGSWAAVRLAVRRLEQTVVVPIDTPSSRFWTSTVTGLRFGFERWKRRRASILSRNPIAWLAWNSWRWRLGRLTLLLGVCLVESWLFAAEPNRLDRLQTQWDLSLLLALVMVVGGTCGFRSEIQSGLMELLMLSPLPSWRIVAARCAATWNLAAPAACVLGFSWVCHLSALAFEDRIFSNPRVLQCLTATVLLVAIPPLALWVSLKVSNTTLAVLCASALGIGGPWAWLQFPGLSLWVHGGSVRYAIHVALGLGIHLLLSALAMGLAVRALKQRRWSSSLPQSASNAASRS